jgi:hypothetical protein
MMKSSPFLPSRWITLLAVLVALIAAVPAYCVDTAKPLCSGTDYKILSPNQIIIECKGLKTSTIPWKGGKVFSGTDLSTQLPVTFTAENYVSDWLSLTFTPIPATASFAFEAQKTYRISLSSSTDAESPASPLISTQIDTSTSLSWTATADGKPNRYAISSHLAFLGLNVGSRNRIPCTLVQQNYSGTFTNRSAHCAQSQYSITMQPDVKDPDSVGLLVLEPDNKDPSIQIIPYKILELQNVLGAPMTVDPKSRLGQGQAPSTKELSNYYVNASFAAGKGSKPGWIVDAKVAPPIGRLYGGWQFAPTATANIGNNSVSGATTADLIDFGVTEARPFELRGALQEIYASGSFQYETDREFDRDNLTGVADLRFNFKNLYSPRAVEALRDFRYQQKIAQKNGITLQPSDVKMPFFGYALDLHGIAEFGGAAVDKTVKASTGGATINLPAYSIFRIAPQVHGLLELGRFNVNVTGTGRYMAATENTVVLLPNNSLQLKTVHGWHGYGILTSAYNIDPAGHYSLSATYQDGFSPPKYSRINTVQMGFVLKY